jgi:hypothetical protein
MKRLGNSAEERLDPWRSPRLDALGNLARGKGVESVQLAHNCAQ